MRYIRINPNDNVVVALDNLKKGELISIDNLQLTLAEDIPTGHKLALKDINKDENIIKYGYPIGHALTDINIGEWIHSHNLKTNLGDNLNYTYSPNLSPEVSALNTASFNGYLRPNGEVGIRNELWIVPTVGCVNGQAQAIVSRLKLECNTEGIDDVRVYTHNYGCSQLGDDHINTQKALAAIINHPNAGAVLVLGLGCENNQISELKSFIGDYNEDRIKFLISQDVEDEIEIGFSICKALLKLMRADTRTQQSISKLRIGLKCGGSDGFSGITANPLLGMLSDWLISQNGTSILTEVPEMFGAETLLMDRSINKDTFNSTVSLINNFKEYFRKYDQPIYENPSPGNKKGGITTLEEKSLGCVQKGGKCNVVDVLGYAQKVKHHGLNLLNAPGNDLVASTALALSGAQIVLFTTGRGTPFGSFVPTMKISTNTRLFNHKNNWIDFNAGTIVEGRTMSSVLEELITFLTEIANGKHLKHEKIGFKDIAIFKTGVTL